MKRFLVFAGQEYEPTGGWGDLKGHFDQLDEAKLFGRFFVEQREKPVRDKGTYWGADYEWVQVVDIRDDVVYNAKTPEHHKYENGQCDYAEKMPFLGYSEPESAIPS